MTARGPLLPWPQCTATLLPSHQPMTAPLTRGTQRWLTSAWRCPSLSQAERLTCTRTSRRWRSCRKLGWSLWPTPEAKRWWRPCAQWMPELAQPGSAKTSSSKWPRWRSAVAVATNSSGWPGTLAWWPDSTDRPRKHKQEQAIDLARNWLGKTQSPDCDRLNAPQTDGHHQGQGPGSGLSFLGEAKPLRGLRKGVSGPTSPGGLWITEGRRLPALGHILDPPVQPCATSRLFPGLRLQDLAFLGLSGQNPQPDPSSFALPMHTLTVTTKMTSVAPNIFVWSKKKHLFYKMNNVAFTVSQTLRWQWHFRRIRILIIWVS